MRLAQLRAGQTTTVLYDGGCPFCRQFVAGLDTAATGGWRFLDLRHYPELVAELNKAGLDPDGGMVVIDADTLHYGADAANFLARTAGNQSRPLDRTLASERIARGLYPLLAAGRRAWLWVRRVPKLKAES